MKRKIGDMKVITTDFEFAKEPYHKHSHKNAYILDLHTDLSGGRSGGLVFPSL